MAHTAHASNIDNHVWGGGVGDCQRILHADTKAGITGSTVATGSIQPSGFDLTYSSVDGSGETFMYVAMNADEGYSLESFTVPSTLSTVSLNNNYQNITTTANATIDDLTNNEVSPSNQNSITFGWSHGQAQGATDEEVLAIAVSSNSTNTHRAAAFTNQVLHLMYTDDNGADDGSNDANVTSFTSTEVDASFSAVASGAAGVNDAHETPPVIVWGLDSTAEEVQIGAVIRSDTGVLETDSLAVLQTQQ